MANRAWLIVACFAIVGPLACGGSSDRRATPRGGAGEAAASGAEDGASGGAGGDAASGVGASAASGAGASSASGAGATAASGAGGAGGAAALPLPAGCDTYEPLVNDEAECALALTCDTIRNLASCKRLESGRWRCTCELPDSDRVYELDGVEGLDACAVAGGLCSLPEPSLGEETCQESAGPTTLEVCSLERTCEASVAVPFAPGSQAWLTRVDSTACSRGRAANVLDCRCDGNAGPRPYQVLAENAALACEPLLDFCLDSTPPEFDGEVTCYEVDSVAGPVYCRLNELCGQSIPLTSDVSVSVADFTEQETDCFTDGCTCWLPGASYPVEQNASPVEAEMCAAAARVCRDQAP